MKIISKETEWTSQKWFGLTAKETKGLLEDAVAYEKFYGNKPKIMIHTSGYLTSGFAQITITHAKQMIDSAFDSGHASIRDYEWVESGHVEGSVHILNFGIVLNISGKIIRNDREEE